MKKSFFGSLFPYFSKRLQILRKIIKKIAKNRKRTIPFFEKMCYNVR